MNQLEALKQHTTVVADSGDTGDILLRRLTQLADCQSVMDMRNSVNDLASRVQNTLLDDPFSGRLFNFRGRRGDMIKVL